MITSRVTSGSKTTIPAAVRRALDLKDGDDIAYAIEEGRVVVTRADRCREDPFATFTEWDSDADREGYADL